VAFRKNDFSHDFDLAIATTGISDGPISHLIDDLPIISINIHPISFKRDIISYGFYGNSTRSKEKMGTDNHNLTFHGRKGDLVNFHLDAASVAGPAVYEADNKIEHMMSGGPTVNHEGSIIGVNSSGLDPDEDNPNHRTIITPFIRAMFMKFEYWIDATWKKTSLYELASSGIIEIIGYEASYSE
jgi:hypothetical protein